MIAVVIPVFNQVKYLGAALDSVAGQSLQPTELVVVDDGSTDGSGELAAARGIRVLRQENSGPAAARWHGVQATTAPYIAFLDGDDLLMPEHHALLSSELERTGATAACGMAEEFADPTTDAAARFEIRSVPRVAAFAGTVLIRRERYLAVAAEESRGRAQHDWFGLLNMLGDRAEISELVLRRRIHGENRSITGRAALHAEYLASARLAILRARGQTQS